MYFRLAIYLIIFSSVQIIFLIPRGLGNDLILDAREAINKYEESLQRFQHCRFKATVLITIDSPSLPSKDYSSQIRYQDVLMDVPSAFRFRCDSTTSLRKDGNWSKSEVSSESNILGKTQKSISWFDGNAKEKFVNAWDNCLSDEQLFDTVNALEFSPILQGYVQGNGRIRVYDLLRQGKPTIRSAQINEQSVLRVDSHTAWGQLTVFLDPAHDYLPVRIHQVKESGDLIQPNLTLGSVNFKGEFGGVDPGKTSTECTIEAKYEEGRVVGTVCDFIQQQISHYANGQSKKDTLKTHVYDLDFTPPSAGDFELTTKVPNKTRVFVENHENLMYEWQDGEIVKTGSVESIAGLARPSKSVWRWLIGVAATVTALAVGWFAYSRMRRRQEAS